MDVGRFKCGVCNHINTIKKPPPEGTVRPSPIQQVKGPPALEPKATKTEYEKVTPSVSHRQGIHFGIRAKMIALFIMVPVVMMAVGNLFWFSRMQSLSNLITEESSQAITKMAEESIAEKSRAVAREVKLYLRTHPGLSRGGQHVIL